MMQYIIAQKSMRKTFRLPLSVEQASSMLLNAYKIEVTCRHRTFESDDPTKENIRKVAEFLTGEEGEFGFMLIGNCGNGKTTLLRAFQDVLNYLEEYSVIENGSRLRIVDAREVTELAKNRKDMVSLKNEWLLAIEDMGRESTEVLDFGNVYNPVIDLLEYRYDQQLFTVFTSNLNPKELKEKYGERIADRFREMFAKIVFSNPSYRN